MGAAAITQWCVPCIHDRDGTDKLSPATKRVFRWRSQFSSGSSTDQRSGRTGQAIAAKLGAGNTKQ